MTNELTLTLLEFYNSGSLIGDITNYICNSNRTELVKVTGKSLGYNIDWTVQHRPGGAVVFTFDNENDKVLFILKYL